MFIPKTKIKILEVLDNNPEGLTAEELIPFADNRKYTAIAKACLLYMRQGLLQRDKIGISRYRYRISEHGKNRLKFLKENNFTS